jgi:uncharacterized protein YbjT (DUF2867 family)
MKVIITGTTGMIGKGVMLECLDHPEVTSVLSLSRRSTGLTHPKLTELLHKDFSDFSPIADQLTGYDACYACMGVSAAGMDEAQYSRMTYDFTLALAREVYALNPAMTFIYVSGVGTDSTEQGRSMWARVKGKTENALLTMGFGQAYMFRPGGIIPRRGIQPSNKFYKIMISYLGWLLKLIKWFSPNSIVDTTQLGQAMIQVTRAGYDKEIIHPKDILILASQDKPES